MRSLTFLVSAILLILATTHHVEASGDIWSMNGASCVPTSASIQGNLYGDTAGTVGWNSSDTGTITVYCPVSFPGLITTDCKETLVMSYQDTDGSGTAATATAQLIQLDGSNGTLTDIGSALSSTTGGSGTSGQYVYENLTSCLNDGYYYVRVDLVRTGSTWVNLIGVQLDGD